MVQKITKLGSFLVQILAQPSSFEPHFDLIPQWFPRLWNVVLRGVFYAQRRTPKSCENRDHSTMNARCRVQMSLSRPARNASVILIQTHYRAFRKEFLKIAKKNYGDNPFKICYVFKKKQKNINKLKNKTGCNRTTQRLNC